MNNQLTKPIRFSYNTPLVPDNYKCCKCRATDCKLWRYSAVFLNQVELLCVDCAVKYANERMLRDYPLSEPVDAFKVYKDGTHDSEQCRSDQFYGLCPAVPTEENDTYWGYTSVPELGCRWWRELPLRMK